MRRYSKQLREKESNMTTSNEMTKYSKGVMTSLQDYFSASEKIIKMIEKENGINITKILLKPTLKGIGTQIEFDIQIDKDDKWGANAFKELKAKIQKVKNPEYTTSATSLGSGDHGRINISSKIWN